MIYTISEFSVKTIPLFLIPLLTSRLSKEEYGIIVNFQVIAYFVNIFTAMGTYSTFWPMLNEQGSIQKVFSQIVPIPFITGLFLSGIALLVISGSFLQVPVIWIIVAIFIAIAEYFNTLLNALWLFQKKPTSNAVFKISRALFEAALIYFTFISYGITWQNRLLIISVTAVSFFAFTFFYLVKNDFIKFVFSWHQTKKIILKSLPAIPYEINLSVRQICERWFILVYLGAAFNGSYGLSIQLTTPIHLLCVALINTLIPYIYQYKNENTRESQKKLQKLIFIYIICIIGFAIAYILLLPLGYKYFIDQKFHDTLSITFLLLIAIIIKNIHTVFSQFILYKKNVKLISKISLCSFIISLSLLFIASKYTTITGIAIAVILAELITFGIIFYHVYHSDFKNKYNNNQIDVNSI